MKREIAVIITGLILSLGAASAQGECFGVLAGRAVTADGSVLLGHNEDDGGEQMVNIYSTTRMGENARYLWVELPGMEVADAFLNEYGVSVASDNCPSREDNGILTDGGVLYEVRLEVARKARTAREGVKIIGEMVERYGYRGSGRTYLIADTNEGWLVSVVCGKHWVAQRVPDDAVALISNFYVIDGVDLTDTDNFDGSPDLIQYAVERGWYDPIKEGKFSFRRAYASESSVKSTHNRRRLASALRHLTGRDYGENPDKFPVFVRPESEKMGVKEVIEVLTLHAGPGGITEEHGDRGCICNDNTVVSTIFQLRGDMPLETGCVMWTALGHPCAEPYIPWYLGAGSAPRGFGRFSDWRKAEDRHLSDAGNLRLNHPKGVYWKVVDRWDSATPQQRLQRRDKVAEFQQLLFNTQPVFENECKPLSGKKLSKRISRYIESCYKASEKIF